MKNLNIKKEKLIFNLLKFFQDYQCEMYSLKIKIIILYFYLLLLVCQAKFKLILKTQKLMIIIDSISKLNITIKKLLENILKLH